LVNGESAVVTCMLSVMGWGVMISKVLIYYSLINVIEYAHIYDECVIHICVHVSLVVSNSRTVQ
jgi:hypothetical protein